MPAIKIIMFALPFAGLSDWRAVSVIIAQIPLKDRKLFMKPKAAISRAVLCALLALMIYPTAQARAALKVTCSSFPVYDFTREITQGLADAALLLKPGTDPHDFEPSARDVKELHDSDVFVFTGPAMEHWAGRIAETLSHTVIADASLGLALKNSDPHVWLDLEMAQQMVMNITRSLCEADPDNAEAFTLNAEAYCAKLSALDAEFMALPKDKPLFFAEEFAAKYFVERYGFDYASAFEGENEPGIKRMAEFIRRIKDNNVHYVFTDDPPVNPVTRAISEQTGAKLLTFSTAHNVSTSTSYLEIVAGNLQSLRTFLND